MYLIVTNRLLATGNRVRETIQEYLTIRDNSRSESVQDCPRVSESVQECPRVCDSVDSIPEYLKVSEISESI